MLLLCAFHVQANLTHGHVCFLGITGQSQMLPPQQVHRLLVTGLAGWGMLPVSEYS